MSGLFGVSTDYLLKDDVEKELPSETEDVYEGRKERAVSLEEANGFMGLVKKLAGRKKPSGVSLKGHNTLIIDGEPHILYQEIRHNDARNTERCMEIEALFSDRIPADEVEKRLNEMIRTQW